MKKMLSYAGWGIAVVALAGLFFQYHFVSRQQVSIIDRHLEERVELAAYIATLRDELESSAADMNALMQRLEDTEATVLIWQDYLTDTFSGTDADRAALPDEIAELLSDTLEEVEEKKFDFSNFEMPEGMSGYMGTMMTEMQYGYFISALDVSPETRDQVRDLITGALKDTYDTVYEGDMEQVNTVGMFPNPELRTQLETILTPEQLAEFDAYEENLPAHMLRRSTRMQLQMFAGELTEENRELVTEILVEEFSAAFEDRDADEDSFDSLSFGGINGGMYENARLRLTELLTPEQLTIYERYADMQTAMMESMSDMMETMGIEE